MNRSRTPKGREIHVKVSSLKKKLHARGTKQIKATNEPVCEPMDFDIRDELSDDGALPPDEATEALMDSEVDSSADEEDTQAPSLESTQIVNANEGEEALGEDLDEEDVDDEEDDEDEEEEGEDEEMEEDEEEQEEEGEEEGTDGEEADTDESESIVDDAKAVEKSSALLGTKPLTVRPEAHGGTQSEDTERSRGGSRAKDPLTKTDTPHRAKENEPANAKAPGSSKGQGTKRSQLATLGQQPVDLGHMLSEMDFQVRADLARVTDEKAVLAVQVYCTTARRIHY